MTSSGSGRKIFISAGSSCHPSIIYFQYAVMFYFNSLIFNEVILFIRGKTCYLNCPFDFNPNRPGGERYPAYCTADLTRPTFMIQHLRSVNFLTFSRNVTPNLNIPHSLTQYRLIFTSAATQTHPELYFSRCWTPHQRRGRKVIISKGR